jgi:hypothetical protein
MVTNERHDLIIKLTNKYNSYYLSIIVGFHIKTTALFVRVLIDSNIDSLRCSWDTAELSRDGHLAFLTLIRHSKGKIAQFGYVRYLRLKKSQKYSFL